MGFPKHLDIQKPRQDIQAWRMDMGRLHISIWDMEHCAIQKAYQQTAHSGSEDIELLGIQDKLHIT